MSRACVASSSASSVGPSRSGCSVTDTRNPLPSAAVSAAVCAATSGSTGAPGGSTGTRGRLHADERGEVGGRREHGLGDRRIGRCDTVHEQRDGRPARRGGLQDRPAVGRFARHGRLAGGQPARTGPRRRRPARPRTRPPWPLPTAARRRRRDARRTGRGGRASYDRDKSITVPRGRARAHRRIANAGGLEPHAAFGPTSRVMSENTPAAIRGWRVGDLARATGLTVRTLHHYDEIGLLTPADRSEGGHRLYDEQDVQRLYRIRLLRRLGLPLHQIAQALDDPAWSLRAALIRHRRELTQRIRLEQQLEHQLDTLDRGHRRTRGQHAAGLRHGTGRRPAAPAPADPGGDDHARHRPSSAASRSSCTTTSRRRTTIWSPCSASARRAHPRRRRPCDARRGPRRRRRDLAAPGGAGVRPAVTEGTSARRPA